MANTVNKHIRVDENDWKRIENAAREQGISPTRLLISTTLEAIDGRARRRDRRDRSQHLPGRTGIAARDGRGRVRYLARRCRRDVTTCLTPTPLGQFPRA